MAFRGPVGKTLAAIILLLRINDPTGAGYLNPRYNAIIYRKHYKDLRDIISKMQLIYPLVDPGAKFHKQDLTWTFTSGARIQVAYFETKEQCESMVQGAEYATVIVDEAMHFADDSIFLYMMSRLRNTFGMKCLMRLTSNPGRYRWLRDYFEINDNGHSTDRVQEYVLEDGTIVRKRIKYIQAKLSDNPHLPKEYAATIMMLSEEDKLALLDGMWNSYESVDGQVYEHELKKLVQDGRNTIVNHDPALPVYTYWDIGIQDLGIVLFVQFLGKEIRIIDMIKNNNVGIQSYYIPEINKRKQDKGYQYAGHYLPHDAAQRDKFQGVSVLDQVRQYLQDVHQLPRLELVVGLEKARQMFNYVWIDKRLELYDDLVKYRREWDESMLMYSQKPVHDKYSHSADAFRMVSYVQPVKRADPNRYVKRGSSNPFIVR